jgi:hypothetical protein
LDGGIDPGAGDPVRNHLSLGGFLDLEPSFIAKFMKGFVYEPDARPRELREASRGDENAVPVVAGGVRDHQGEQEFLSSVWRSREDAAH